MKPIMVLRDHGTIVGEKFLAYDGNELDVVWHDGQPRICGLLPPKKGHGIMKLSSIMELMPRSEWRDVSYRGYHVPTDDQSQTCSCVGHAVDKAFWRQWLIQNLPLPPGGFSACWIYSLINNGWDMGANISDAMMAVMKHGVALLNDVPEGVIYQRRISCFPDVARRALRFRVKNAYHCETVDEIGTAIQRGLMVVAAIRASSGWVPDPSTFIAPVIPGPGNHAQHFLGMKILPDGRVLFEGQNSYGPSFGDGGYYYAQEAALACESQDAFAIEFNAQDPESLHLPPTA